VSASLPTLTVSGAVAVLLGPGVELDGGSIEVPAQAQGTLDVSGCVVTPGLVNAHHHLLQSAFRTLPGTRGVPMREWLGIMAAAYAGAGHDPELYGSAAAVGAAEGLLCGVTTIADHHLNWPRGASVTETVELAAATARAAGEIGGRLVFVRGSAGDEPGWAAASAEAICAELVGRGGPGGDAGGGPGGGVTAAGPGGGVTADGRLQVAVGPAGVHSDARETFEALGDVAARHGLRRRTQANEQVDTELALARYTRRPLDLLEEWGWLEPDVTLAHLCDITEEELARLAAAGVSATHAPGCDIPMGWGIAPVAQLLDAGVAVGLGTSGGGSNDAGHLLADARLAMQVSALVGPQLPARTVLAMATSGSAAGLGRPELGHLGPGTAGDLCAWDVSGVADAGIQDPIAGLLWGSPGRRPRHVVVGGSVVVRDYELVNVEEAHLVARLKERLHRR
jgi:cytosine/adenosine deaminase-related metal-dependent hydrolase